MKRTFLLVISLFLIKSYSQIGDANKENIKIQSEEIQSEENRLRVNWAKLATNPDPWFGKNITLEGWVKFDVGFAQSNPYSPILIYESHEAMVHSLHAKSIKMMSEDFLSACENEVYPTHALALMLQGKLVEIRGTCRPSAGGHSLCDLANGVEISVFRSQDIRNLPDSILKPAPKSTKTK